MLAPCFMLLKAILKSKLQAPGALSIHKAPTELTQPSHSPPAKQLGTLHWLQCLGLKSPWDEAQEGCPSDMERK